MACARGFLRFCANLGPGIVPGQVTQPMVFAGAGAGLAGVGAQQEFERSERGSFTHQCTTVLDRVVFNKKNVKN